MGLCFVADCRHRSDACGKKCRLFTFPRNTSDQRRWEKLCRRYDRRLNPKDDRICSCHFKDGQKENGPTLFSWNAGRVFDFPDPSPKRKKRVPAPRTVDPQLILTDHNYANPCEILACKMTLLSLQNQVDKLEKDLAREIAKKKRDGMSITQIQDDDEKMVAYTSIPYDVFHILVISLKRFHINYHAGWKVTSILLEDQLLLTLMKLRLNLRDFDLAYRFKTSKGTVSNIVNTMVTALHELLFVGVLGVGIPSQLKCKGSMPKSFEEFVSARVAIDATEITQDIPQNLESQAASYSSYKSRHTVKSVTGVAPNAAIVYVSDLYPGSTSDVAIVAHSKMMSQFEGGDLILADKGFTIHNLLPTGVSLNIPPFLIGKSHFTAEEAKMCLKIARARIHVEQANERIKNFEILNHIRARYRPLSTKIFQVCCCLVNLQAPLLKEISAKYRIEE